MRSAIAGKEMPGMAALEQIVERHGRNEREPFRQSQPFTLAECVCLDSFGREAASGDEFDDFPDVIFPRVLDHVMRPAVVGEVDGVLIWGNALDCLADGVPADEVRSRQHEPAAGEKNAVCFPEHVSGIKEKMLQNFAAHHAAEMGVGERESIPFGIEQDVRKPAFIGTAKDDLGNGRIELTAGDGARRVLGDDLVLREQGYAKGKVIVASQIEDAGWFLWK